MGIQVTIANKRATVSGAPVIVCGNSGYTVNFTFDTDWDGMEYKTARFVYVQAGEVKYQDVVFAGTTAEVPVMANTKEVRVGVFAGELRTSTPAVIPCELSIRCGTGAPDDPTPSQYDQIMALLAAGGGGGGTGSGGDGFSPIAKVKQTTTGATITITDKTGTTTATVKNGKDGEDGTPGDPGKSAYAYAKDGGYTGTEEEFAQKLAKKSAAPPLRLFASGVESGTTVNPIEIKSKNPSTDAAYTAEEISQMAMTRPIVMNTTRATMYGNIDGTFRYYRAVQINSELAYVEFTGHYADLEGKWIPATAKVGVDGVVTITDAEWKSTGSGGAITPGIENAGKLLYVDDAGNGAFLQLGDGLEIVNGRLCITGTVTPDEPAEAIAFEQTGENSVAVSGVVFEQQEDGTVLWRGATFTPGEENSVVIK